MQVRFVFAPEEQEPAASLKRAVESCAEQINEAATLAGVRPSARASFTLTVVIRSAAGMPSIEEAIAFAQAHHGATYVAFVADDVPAADYRRLLSTGAGEWLPLASAESELAQLVARLATSARAQPADVGRSLFSAFIPTSGGAGNTTLCVETAVRLARMAAKSEPRVCVLDLNLQRANVCDLLDVEPQLDLLAIAADPARLDDQLLEAFRSRTGYGVDVFAPSKFSLDVDAPPVEAIFALCNAVAQRYDFINADLPPYLFGWAQDIIRNSDVGVVTTAFSVPAARRAAATMRRLDELGVSAEALLLAVNQTTGGLFGGGLRRSEFEASLPAARKFYVPRDAALAAECANFGKPMVVAGPRKPVARGNRRPG